MTVYEPGFKTHVSHAWWRKINLAYLPGPTTSLLDEFSHNLLDHFYKNGHTLVDSPEDACDVVLTTAMFGEPIRWRDCMIINLRRRYHLEHNPMVFTIVQATPQQFQERLDAFTTILKKDPPDPEDYELPGMAPEAYKTLFEQGRRGGPMLALLRTVQTQAMSIRIILVVGEEHPQEAYVFDLVGAYPRDVADDPDVFYDDIVGRVVTAISTHEITDHQLMEQAIPHSTWINLSAPPAMLVAGTELGKREFFTEMVRVDNLTQIPAIPDVIASQYSEGCFATWEPEIDGLIATVTGSARPVDKENLTDDELAVIVGVRPDGQGAIIRHIEGKRNDPPSSEAVELIELDKDLPRIAIDFPTGGPREEKSIKSFEVPVSRSKLHGHRGVRAYDPRFVEHVFLDEPFYYFPVSCSTEAQAHAIRSAFARSQALQNPADPRRIVFTILPGHGIVIVEKWIPGKAPFQAIWEAMDAGHIVIDTIVPQGPLTFASQPDGLMAITEP